MCGFAGIFSCSPPHAVDLELAVGRMANAIRHRGPDDAGTWCDETSGLALAHRRLSIVDLSPAGHQPMCSPCGRFVLAFNGEIYNHRQLREALDKEGVGGAWRGHADTETLLRAFACWGVEQTLQRAVGMFAISLWDRWRRTLYLARDRFGEKPLYYGWSAGVFLFASELKALRAYPGFSNPVSREALAQYLQFMYVPTPLSIHESIYKLEPGCLLTIKEQPPAFPPAALALAPAVHGSLSLHRWWSLLEGIEVGVEHPPLDEQSLIDRLEKKLQRAVRQQSLADVPLGAFLSGGVDSSLIVALMQQQSARPVQTYTVGFDEAGFDESPYAQAVARHLGTEHHTLMVSVAEARDVIPHLPRMYDEPFADSSQIPTHLICRAARRQVTVALSGDAGDELFGGYNRYLWGPRIWQRVAAVPYPLRQLLMRGLQLASTLPLEKGAGALGVVRLAEKLQKLARALEGARSIDDLYVNLISERHPRNLLLGTVAEAAVPIGGTRMPSGLLDATARMMLLDTLTYLPDDILCKVDRAAMAIGLETRVPFLDHRVAEFAWQLPMSMKIRGGQGKWVLRQILYKFVPKALIERPKAGFALPVGQWLRGPLRPWAEDLLDEARIRRQGYFDDRQLRQLWRQHLAGERDWTARLWSVLMFQSWQEENAVSLPMVS